MSDDRPRLAPFELPPAEPSAPPGLSRLVPLAGPSAAPKHALAPTRLEPLNPDVFYVESWFSLMEAVDEPDGLTARQVARRMTHEPLRETVDALLSHLADVGDVVRRGGGAQRYKAQPLERRLAWHLREALAQSPAGEGWEALRAAIATHQKENKQYTWNQLREAFAQLVESLPGWPVQVKEAARLHAERWLPRIAEVTPPVHLREEDELLRLREEVRVLHALLAEAAEREGAALPTGTPATGGRNALLKRRVDELEEENAELRAAVADLTLEANALEAELDDLVGPDDETLVDAFLEGSSTGPFPAQLGLAEAERLRALIQDTRAPLAIQRAMVAKLAAVYRRPHHYQRLTSAAFADASHPFETLHRARVGHYRLGYGIAKRVPTVIHIGPRENFYRIFLNRLEAWCGR
ncbi:MAG: hypothetical protein VKP62_10905 [Candidatus Sericytochromatia bacterium]|nr:hypothetical protein [Candidatus Sericytochromatia bacterium]